MIRYFLDNNGQVKNSLNGDYDLVELNTDSSAVYVDLDEPLPNTADYFYSFKKQSFLKKGDPPTPHHNFDFTSMQWIDPRTLDEIKTQKWDKIKSQRNQLEFGGFEFDGITYDSDQVSQGRIMGAALAGVNQVWTTADNRTVVLTSEDIKEMYQAMQAHIAYTHERGRIARLAIETAVTKEDVESVVL